MKTKSGMAARTSLYKIGLEFEFPEEFVRTTLLKLSFKDAGSFIDYLEDHENDYNQRVPEGRKATVVQSPQHQDKQGVTEDRKTTHKTKPSELQAETLQLYKATRCTNRNCKEQRTRLCLPCCHFSLCDKCAQNLTRCPFNSCQTEIIETIRTYVS